jgi:hypothetical protein
MTNREAKESALLGTVKIRLIMWGTLRPTVRHIVQTVIDAGAFLGLQNETGYAEMCDKATRHLIAEGELKKEFDHG